MNGSLDMSEFEAANTGHTGATCRISLLDLPPERQAQLDHVIWERLDISSKAIAKVLADWGSPLSAQTVARHRRGDCLCKNGKT
jgi:hypothetical protein